MMPHLPYADAVHAALTEADLAPETLSATETDDGQFVVLIEWPTVRTSLRWHSGTGWRHSAPHCGGPMFVDHLADPAAIAEAAGLLLDGFPPHTTRARWTGAPTLDRALAARGI
ncbi:hypothetical protein [Streptomyces sp. NRRL F-5727]|uniref:hypothetical protein n=1 Tax=Streptomyces sp. NRRL F-5727 TaxID=1463871 RepID=UPI0004CBE76D|nr:hypothetical protein [Streptomyces sp. NRRL F-5727]